MREVIISIQPHWCGLIASGQKIIELRKTAPKITTPFRCYIYCTMGDELVHTNAKPFCKNADGSTVYKTSIMNGKVIGEFICSAIEGVTQQNRHEISQKSCVPLSAMHTYAGQRGIYGLKAWHISDLVIYDDPKPLYSFYTYDNSHDNASGWVFPDREKRRPITRPPQSWFYVPNQNFHTQSSVSQL